MCGHAGVRVWVHESARVRGACGWADRQMGRRVGGQAGKRGCGQAGKGVRARTSKGARGLPVGKQARVCVHV